MEAVVFDFNTSTVENISKKGPRTASPSYDER